MLAYFRMVCLRERRIALRDSIKKDFERASLALELLQVVMNWGIRTDAWIYMEAVRNDLKTLLKDAQCVTQR